MGIFALITKHFPPVKTYGGKARKQRATTNALPTVKTARALTEAFVLEFALERLRRAPKNLSTEGREMVAADIAGFINAELSAAK